jgi:hypothetical protein
VIRESGQDGAGLALAGIIVGWIVAVIGAAIVTLIVIAAYLWVQHEPPHPQYS